MHSTISPAILYWGTPVVLVTSSNPDGTTNISAISSVFWLGHRAILGFGAQSHTPQNILRTKQCVINLPTDAMTGYVNALATTTGSMHPSASKVDRGYRYVYDKWSHTGLTQQTSDLVQPYRIQECPVQMECEMVVSHSLMQDAPQFYGMLVTIELRVLRIHVLYELRMDGHANRINPDKWRPMIMSFQQLYGLRAGQLDESTLGRIDEEKYRPITLTGLTVTDEIGRETISGDH